MSAPRHLRSIAGPAARYRCSRRHFSSTLGQAEAKSNSGPGPRTTPSPRGWSGAGVAAVSIAAGIIGFGVASMKEPASKTELSGRNDHPESKFEPQYATVKEMEQVGDQHKPCSRPRPHAD